MPEGGTLLVIAQVALGLVGFGALIIALQPRPLSTWRAPDQFRFHNFVVVGLLVTFAAILPSVVYFLTDSPTLSFRISAGAYGALLILRTIQRFRHNLDMLKFRGSHYSRPILILSLGMFYVGLGILLAITLGILREKTGALYTLVLYANLSMAALIFYRLMVSTSAPDEE